MKVTIVYNGYAPFASEISDHLLAVNVDAAGTGWNNAIQINVNSVATVAVVKYKDASNYGAILSGTSGFMNNPTPGMVVEVFADGGDITLFPPSQALILPGTFFDGSSSIVIPAGQGRRFRLVVSGKFALIG